MRALLVVTVLATLLGAPSGAALAHAGEPHAPEELLGSWNWDAAILLGLGLAAWLYGRGLRQVWQKAGVGRGVTVGQAAAFGAGLATLFAALVSPLEAMSGALLSAHMVQHLLLILAAAPLLVLGAPPPALAWAAPASWRVGLARWWRRQRPLQRAWRGISHPLAAWSLHALAITAWHLPVLYQAAVRNELAHQLEHASFLGTALLFWWTLAQCGRPGRLPYPAGLLYAFTTALYSGVLGALLTFSRQAWYPIYAESALQWGLTPLEDQQLAGAIMWVPGNFVYLAAVLWLLWAWFKEMDRKESRALGRVERARRPEREVQHGAG